MPRSLADGHVKLSIMSVVPVNPLAPTVTELTAGVDAACRILSSDFALGPTASDKISEKALCQEGNSSALGPSNFDGTITAFRYFNLTTNIAETSAGAEIGDAVYQALKTKGSQLWIGKRFTSKLSTAAWAATDEVSVFQVLTDNGIDGDLSGYIKKTVPLVVVNAWLNGTVAGP